MWLIFPPPSRFTSRSLRMIAFSSLFLSFFGCCLAFGCLETTVVICPSTNHSLLCWPATSDGRDERTATVKNVPFWRESCAINAAFIFRVRNGCLMWWEGASMVIDYTHFSRILHLFSPSNECQNPMTPTIFRQPDWSVGFKFTFMCQQVNTRYLL